MQPKPGTYCPIIKDDCMQFKCMFWTHLRGMHPQSGADIDEYDCAVKWLPLLLIENAQKTNQTAAVMESFRNEVVKSANGLIGVIQERKMLAAKDS